MMFCRHVVEAGMKNAGSGMPMEDATKKIIYYTIYYYYFWCFPTEKQILTVWSLLLISTELLISGLGGFVVEVSISHY
jgi:hypothetical protein